MPEVGFVEVEGADKLALLGKAVRKLGSDRTILKHLTKRVKKLGAPIRAELKASAVATLPRRGGLGVWVAKSRINVTVRRGADTAGVSITEGRNSAGGRSDLRRINAGTTRHPYFGKRSHWYPQRVNAGFATKVFEGPIVTEFRNQTLAAIDDSIAEVLRGI